MLDISTWPGSETVDLAREVAALGLEREAYELEMFGLTMIPADRTGAAGLAAEALELIFDLIEQRHGTRPDPVTGSTHTDVFVPSLHHIAHEGEAIEKLLCHPMATALSSLLVGRRSVLLGTEVFMKGPATGGDTGPFNLDRGEAGLQLGLHSDNVTIPEPFPNHPNLCNVTWMLSDYTKENGALAFVPGSHRLRRQPRRGEGAKTVVPVEGPAGSLVIWSGNTWHGSYPRMVPGLRTSLAFAIGREYMHPFEPIRDKVTDDMIKRNPERFAVLMGRQVVDWAEQGPDYAKLVARPFRYTQYT